MGRTLEDKVFPEFLYLTHTLPTPPNPACEHSRSRAPADGGLTSGNKCHWESVSLQRGYSGLSLPQLLSVPQRPS